MWIDKNSGQTGKRTPQNEYKQCGWIYIELARLTRAMGLFGFSGGGG